jgi:hypothetical protein
LLRCLLTNPQPMTQRQTCLPEDFLLRKKKQTRSDFDLSLNFLPSYQYAIRFVDCDFAENRYGFEGRACLRLRYPHQQTPEPTERETENCKKNEKEEEAKKGTGERRVGKGEPTQIVRREESYEFCRIRVLGESEALFGKVGENRVEVLAELTKVHLLAEQEEKKHNEYSDLL